MNFSTCKIEASQTLTLREKLPASRIYFYTTHEECVILRNAGEDLFAKECL